MSMSKLALIQASLQEDQRLCIVGVRHDELGSRLCLDQKVCFLVAPKTGLIYTAKGLTRFMASLVPGLQPDVSLRFTERKGVLESGYLLFEEEIGKVTTRREIVLNDKDEEGFELFADGSFSSKSISPLRRSIFVRPFPNVQCAQNVLASAVSDMQTTCEMLVYQWSIRRLIRTGLFHTVA